MLARLKYFEEDYAGLVAYQDIKENDIVMDFIESEYVSERTRTSIQILPKLHVEHDLGKFLNHSCEPNCVIQGIALVALRDIKKDEELFFNYLDTEDEISNPFICKCCERKIEKVATKKETNEVEDKNGESEAL